jgi:hypothetical protein
MREKLIELLGNIYLPMTCGPDTIGEYCIPHKFKKEIADHLIANGVTVQKWIPVTERLPEVDERVLVYLTDDAHSHTKIDTDRIHNNRWVRWGRYVTHWMYLPEQPKGE